MLATRDARELTLKTLVGGGEADGGGDDGDGETDHDDDARDPHHVLIDADDGDGDDEKDELHRETKLDEIGEDVSARAVHHEVGLVAEGRHEGGARGEHEQKRHLFQRKFCASAAVAAMGSMSAAAALLVTMLEIKKVAR